MVANHREVTLHSHEDSCSQKENQEGGNEEGGTEREKEGGQKVAGVGNAVPELGLKYMSGRNLKVSAIEDKFGRSSEHQTVAVDGLEDTSDDACIRARAPGSDS